MSVQIYKKKNNLGKKLHNIPKVSNFDPLFQGKMKTTLQIEKLNYINVKERDRF